LCVEGARAEAVRIYFEKEATMFWNPAWVSVDKLLNAQEDFCLVFHPFETVLSIMESEVS
jgi:hypothetical protein